MRWLTEGLLTTYGRCHTRFVFKPPFPVPKRTLTEPSASKHNGGADNENYDLIMHVGDTLGSAAVGGQAGLLAGSRYTILGSLGQGTFGQVVKCRDEVQGRLVAVKVLKNRPAYYKQGLLEVGILTAVNTNCDPTKKHCCLRVLDHFLFFNHLCIVTELLSMNIYELIKQGNFRGLNVRLVRALLKQVLYAMIALDREHIVHCDLKPENILLDQPREARITLIDFGSACYEHSTLYTYIQSRHYRAPEVILGLQYSTAIDMWSLGCIAAELVLGIPIFPGANEYNQLYKITQMLGPVPSCMIEKGAKGARFYKADSAVMGRYVLKTPAEYERDTGLPIPEDKRYVKYKSLEELARCVNIRTIAGDGTNVPEVRRSLLSFLSAILVIDPTKRLTPAQAFEHPFITGKPLPEDYTPPPRESPPPPITEYKRHDKSSLKLRAPPSETYATFCRNIFEDHKFVDIATGVTLCLLKDPLVPARELIMYNSISHIHTHIHTHTHISIIVNDVCFCFLFFVHTYIYIYHF